LFARSDNRYSKPHTQSKNMRLRLSGPSGSIRQRAICAPHRGQVILGMERLSMRGCALIVMTDTPRVVVVAVRLKPSGFRSRVDTQGLLVRPSPWSAHIIRLIGDARYYKRHSASKTRVNALMAAKSASRLSPRTVF
jgi:hypothetical protein